MPPKRKAKATKSSGIDTSWRKKVRAEDKERGLFLQAEDEDLKDKEFQILVDSRYTSVFPPSTPQKAQRQHRWWWTGPTPLSDPEKLPPLWNCAEPDLDDDDIEGQIQRCHERIGDRIMPEIFRRRLARYEARKEEKDKLMASEPGLEWEVVQRVKDLTAIRQNLEEDGDPDEEIPNILAIVDAYRKKRLKWKEGKITYWAKGKRIDKNPQEFSWDDFERKAADTGSKGLWVEGVC